MTVAIITYKELSTVRWYAYPTQEHACPEAYHHYGELKHLGEELAIRRTTWSHPNGTRMPDTWEFARILRTHKRTEAKAGCQSKRLAEIPTRWEKFTPYCRWQSFQVNVRSGRNQFHQRGVVNLDEVTHICSAEQMLYLHIEGKPYRKRPNGHTREWTKENGQSVLDDYYRLSGVAAEDGTLRDAAYLVCARDYSAQVVKISPRIKLRKDGSAVCEPWL